VEVEITAYSNEGNLNGYFEELCAGSSLVILRVKNKVLMERSLTRADESETLEALDPEAVFDRCLDAYEIPMEERAALKETYSEALGSMQNADSNAE